MTTDKTDAVPDEIYITDFGPMGGSFQTYDSGRNEIKYIRAQPEPEQPDAALEDIQLIRNTAGDLDRGYFTKEDGEVFVRGNIGGPVSRACDRLESALQARVVDAAVLKAALLSPVNPIREFGMIDEAYNNGVQIAINHIASQGLVIKKGGE